MCVCVYLYIFICIFFTYVYLYTFIFEYIRNVLPTVRTRPHELPYMGELLSHQTISSGFKKHVVSN